MESMLPGSIALNSTTLPAMARRREGPSARLAYCYVSLTVARINPSTGYCSHCLLSDRQPRRALRDDPRSRAAHEFDAVRRGVNSSSVSGREGLLTEIALSPTKRPRTGDFDWSLCLATTWFSVQEPQ